MLFGRKNQIKKVNNIVYYGEFTFNTETKTIVDFRNKLTKSTKVVIPEKINGITVENIGDYAFRKKGVTSFNLSKTIKHFGKGCFLGNKIEEMIVPLGMLIPEKAYLVC
jgi:hypothetical protein